MKSIHIRGKLSYYVLGDINDDIGFRLPCDTADILAPVDFTVVDAHIHITVMTTDNTADVITEVFITYQSIIDAA